jgi:hypothetical protein
VIADILRLLLACAIYSSQVMGTFVFPVSDADRVSAGLQQWKPGLCFDQARMWMHTELDRLKHLVVNCGYTARQAVADGYFPCRSVEFGRQQMRRRSWKRISMAASRR